MFSVGMEKIFFLNTVLSYKPADMTKSKPNDTPLRVLYEKIHVVFAVTNDDPFTVFLFI